jgi:hypothetical protein
VLEEEGISGGERSQAPDHATADITTSHTGSATPTLLTDGATYLAAGRFEFIGRLPGDRMVDRFGQRVAVRTGGLIPAAGAGTAPAFPSVPGNIGGFVALGFGSPT